METNNNFNNAINEICAHIIDKFDASIQSDYYSTKYAEIRIRLNKTTDMVAFRNDIAEIAKAYGLKSAANGNGLYVDILLHR